DFAEQGMVTGHRDTTTVATQALYLLNDPFVRRQSLDLAERLLQQGELDEAGRVALAYRLTLGRPPTASEIERTRSYMADFESAPRETSEESPEEPTRKPVEVAAAPKEAETQGNGAKPPVPPIDPDQVIPVDAPVE